MLIVTFKWIIKLYGTCVSNWRVRFVTPSKLYISDPNNYTFYFINQKNCISHQKHHDVLKFTTWVILQIIIYSLAFSPPVPLLQLPQNRQPTPKMRWKHLQSPRSCNRCRPGSNSPGLWSWGTETGFSWSVKTLFLACSWVSVPLKDITKFILIDFFLPDHRQKESVFF